METTSPATSPMRVTDIVNAKTAGAGVVVKTRFEILPVDFQHGNSPFQAYIFLAQFHGTINEVPFTFRKCYARGCPTNLCTHVSQAVNIANRYLQRDYQALQAAGIHIEQALFTLDAMVVKFEHLKDDPEPPLTIPDLVSLAQSGNPMTVELSLDYIPAVEHFAGKQKKQTFLAGEITARIGEKTYRCQRCFSSYATENAAEGKPLAIKVANARLELMFADFKRAGITFEAKFFR